MEKINKKKLLKAYNKLLFINKQDIDPTDAKVVSDILVQDYLILLYKLFVLTMGSIGVKEFTFFEAMKFFRDLMNLERDKLTAVKAFLNFFQKLRCNGMGFAPGVINRSRTSQQNLNCLSRAATFGSLLESLGFTIKLGLIYDHAVIILYLDSEIYFCDPTHNKCTKLYGTSAQYQSYDWYTVDAKDGLDFGILVFQDFRLGIMHAVFESFEAHSMKLMNLEFDKRKHIEYQASVLSVDWKSLRRQLLSELDDYKSDHEDRYTLECFHVMEIRRMNELKCSFIMCLCKAVAKVKKVRYTSLKQKDILDFLNEFDSIARPYRKEILRFVEKGTEFNLQLNESIVVFLQRMYVQSAKNKSLRKYIYIQFSERLKKQRKKKTS